MTVEYQSKMPRASGEGLAYWPVGWPTHGLTIVGAALVLWGFRKPYFVHADFQTLLGQLCVFAASVWWAARGLIRLSVSRDARLPVKSQRGAWARWLVLPMAIVLVTLMTAFEAPLRVAHYLSRDAMMHYAGSPHGGPAGLYQIYEVRADGTGWMFRVTDGGLLGMSDDCWFYCESSGARPSVPAFEPMGGGWWVWRQ